MEGQFCIILLDKIEVIIRLYEATNQEWKLTHYQSKHLEIPSENSEIDASLIIEVLAEFLSSEEAKVVNDWRICARSLPQPLLQDVSKATGFPVENLTPAREQELICKGMFTELW